jgi:hypothetical protein
MAYTLIYLLRRLRGFLLLLKESLRYSATASRDVTQLRPILRARKSPLRANRPRCLIVSPLNAAASDSEMSSSPSKGLLRETF